MDGSKADEKRPQDGTILRLKIGTVYQATP